MLFKFRYLLTKNAIFITIGISLITPAFLAWQHFDKKATESIQRGSKITMRIGALRDTDIIFSQVNDRIVYRQKYKCILSNEGSIKEGIIHWDILYLDEQAYRGEKKTKYTWYAGINPRLIDENNQNISLPLNVSARDNKVIYIEVGTIVPINAWQAVNKKIKLNKPIAWQQAESIFIKAGYPLLGQLIPTETSKSDNFTVYEAGDSYQSFWIRFIKTNDYQITGEFGINVSDLYKQGET